MQAYLAAAQTAEGVVAEAGLDEADSERVGSVLTNLVDALAPARWRSSAKRCATASPPCGDAADRANENRARRKVSSDDDYSSPGPGSFIVHMSVTRSDERSQDPSVSPLARQAVPRELRPFRARLDGPGNAAVGHWALAPGMRRHRHEDGHAASHSSHGCN